MADIEKVVKGLECCTTKPEHNCEVCPYYGEDIGGWPCKSPQMKMDALELLKDYKQHLQNDLETLKEEKRRLEFEHETQAFMYKEKDGLMTITIKL